MPEDTQFATKGEMARHQIEAALNVGIPQGSLLADAAYGDETGFRVWLSEHQIRYAVGVRPGTTVWYGTHQTVPNPAINTRGKTRTHLVRDAKHQPISVKALAQGLAPSCFRTVTWR